MKPLKDEISHVRSLFLIRVLINNNFLILFCFLWGGNLSFILIQYLCLSMFLLGHCLRLIFNYLNVRISERNKINLFRNIYCFLYYIFPLTNTAVFCMIKTTHISNAIALKISTYLLHS